MSFALSFFYIILISGRVGVLTLCREDCYHLSRLLPDVSEGGDVGLEGVFGEFARLRQPRTAALVKQARHLGEQRVVLGGPALCQMRDAMIVAAWSDPKAVAEGLDRLFREPF